MSLDPGRLAEKLLERMLGVEGASDNQAMRDFCAAISEAVIEELKDHAVVDGEQIT